MVRGLASAKPPAEMRTGGRQAGRMENGAEQEVEEVGRKKEEAGGRQGGRSMAEEAGGERREGGNGGERGGEEADGRREQEAGGEAATEKKPGKSELKYEKKLTVCVEQLCQWEN